MFSVSCVKKKTAIPARLHPNHGFKIPVSSTYEGQGGCCPLTIYHLPFAIGAGSLKRRLPLPRVYHSTSTTGRSRLMIRVLA